MVERDRLESKKISKTNAVTSQLDYDLGEENVHIGPSDYVAWLTDRKWAYIRLEGRTFGDVPLNVELKLEVWDSPNSAGVVIDAVRMVKLALDRGMSGTLEGPSAYLMKSPPIQYPFQTILVGVIGLLMMILFTACAGVAGTNGTNTGGNAITGAVVSVNPAQHSAILNVNGQQVTVSGLTDQQVTTLQTQVGKTYTIQVTQGSGNSYTINPNSTPELNETNTDRKSVV